MPKKINKLFPTEVLSEYFGVHFTIINKGIAGKTRYDIIYFVFNDTKITRSEKKRWLYDKFNGPSENVKDNIWSAFLGDIRTDFAPKTYIKNPIKQMEDSV